MSSDPWILELVDELTRESLAVQVEPRADRRELAEGFVRKTIGAAWKVAEGLALEHADAAAAMGAELARPEEVELHRRRALEAKRIAAEIAALRAEVERGGTVESEVRALRRAQGGRDALADFEPEPPPDTPPELDDSGDPDLDAVGELMAKAARSTELDHGAFKLTIHTGALALPSPDVLFRIGSLDLQIAGPVRLTAVKSERVIGGQNEVEVGLTASAAVVSIPAQLFEVGDV